MKSDAAGTGCEFRATARPVVGAADRGFGCVRLLPLAVLVLTSVPGTAPAHESWIEPPSLSSGSFAFGGASGRGLPGQDDEIELAEARDLLGEGTETENGNEYRRAVSLLLEDGSEASIGFLKNLLGATAGSGETADSLKAEVVLQAFGMKKRTDILSESLQLLGSRPVADRVADEARNYLESLVRDPAHRRASIATISGVLEEGDREGAMFRGAARAAAVVLDLDLVLPLVSAMERAVGEELREELRGALVDTTYEDFGANAVAWREWRRSINGKARNDLADRKIDALRDQRDAMERRLAATITKMLSAATAEQACSYLADELEAVRMAAQSRLLALAAEPEANPGLAGAVQPVAQRLEGFVDAVGQPGAISDREGGSLARLYVRLAPNDCRPLLLKVLENTPVESALQLELMDSLVAVATGPDDLEVAERLYALANERSSDKDKVKVLAALTGLGGTEILGYLTSHLGVGSEEVREATVVGAAAVAGRVGESTLSFDLFELLLARLEVDESERVRTSVSKALVDVVGTLSGASATAAFDELDAAMRRQLASDVRDDRRFLELGLALCKVPKLGGRALTAVSEMLGQLGGGADTAVPAGSLLRRIKELIALESTPPTGLEMTLAPIVQYLPVGGGRLDKARPPIRYEKVEIDAISAWNAVLARVGEADLGAQRSFLETASAKACNGGRDWWGADALARLVALGTDAAVAARIQWERAGILLEFVASESLPLPVRALGAREAWTVLAEFASSAGGTTMRLRPEGLVERTVLEHLILDLGPHMGSLDADGDAELVANAARWADSLADAMAEGEPRLAIALERAACFLRRAGFPDRARARYEQLLGPGGTGSALRPEGELLVRSLLDLAELYLAANPVQEAEARAVLLQLPGNLAGVNHNRREELQKRLDGDGGSAPQRGGGP